MNTTAMHCRAQRGVSLIEVLIALVVLSVGFVGYAGLQMIGVRTASDSLLRTQALNLAENMVERMHANRSAINDVEVNGGNSLYAGLRSANIDCSAPPVNCDRMGNGTAAAMCNVPELVTWDAYTVYCGFPAANGETMGGIQDTLPDGGLAVDCIGAGGACLPGSAHQVTVSWEELESDGDANADQDGDGDTLMQTRQVQLQVVP
jgi:type IV pilus assembly protein PilV